MKQRCEKEMNQVLNRAFQEQTDFVSWFCGKTKFTGDVAYHWSLADYPGGNTLEVRSLATGAIEVAENEGEPDVLIVATLGPSRRVALHIENKLNSDVFMAHQAELYAARAKAWVGNPKFESYDDWQTVLVAPRAFYERYPADASKFNVFIAHEDIAMFLPEFEVGGRAYGSGASSRAEC